MSENYVLKEVTKILEENKDKKSLGYALVAAWLMGHYKGFNLKVIELPEDNSLADYFVICSTTNSTQSNAIADEIGALLSKLGLRHSGQEGKSDSDWILIDFKDIIVHIFADSARDSYALEERWEDGALVEIPSHFYHEIPDEDDQNSKTDKDEKTFF